MFNRPDPKHLKILKKGVGHWNQWRDENMMWPKLTGAKLGGWDLREFNLSMVDFSWADLQKADFSGANLYRAKLHDADLSGAVFHGATLDEAEIMGAKVKKTDFTGAHIDGLIWSDLVGAIGVERLTKWRAPSDPPRRSKNRIPLATGAAKALTSAGSPSGDGLRLFVSYTGKDAEAARALILALENKGHRCWNYLAEPVLEQANDAMQWELIDRIRHSNAVIVLMSPRSTSRSWVGVELTVAHNHLKRIVYVANAPLEKLGHSAKRASQPNKHTVVFQPEDVAGTARRALEVVINDDLWGMGQPLHPAD